MFKFNFNSSNNNNILQKNLCNNPKRYTLINNTSNIHINILYRFTKSITTKNIYTEINIWGRREKLIKNNLK